MCNRPYSDLIEMRRDFIARHNSKVTKHDTTHHAGDFAWRKIGVEDASAILEQLNGNHVLYWGNHDETAEKLQRTIGDTFRRFSHACDRALVRTPGFPKVYCDHYAHRVWPDSHKGSYHVYGHTHSVLPDFRRSHDCGVDANNYFPISTAELHELMLKKGKLPPDEVELDMLAHPWPTKEAAVAQPVEHLPCKQDVTSSNLVGGSKFAEAMIAGCLYHGDYPHEQHYDCIGVKP